MSLSVFGEKALIPDETMLAEALAGSLALWDGIKAHVASVCGDYNELWKFYSKKAGWSLVVKSGARTILYLIPQEAYFKVNFVFGERAVEAVLGSGLPAPVVTALSEAHHPPRE